MSLSEGTEYNKEKSQTENRCHFRVWNCGASRTHLAGSSEWASWLRHFYTPKEKKKLSLYLMKSNAMEMYEGVEGEPQKS